MQLKSAKWWGNSMKYLIAVLLVVSSFSLHAQKKKKIIYKYKQFEKFDFQEIGVEGESGSPGDLSVSPNPRKDYGNRLPERRQFNKEIRKAASGIR